MSFIGGMLLVGLEGGLGFLFLVVVLRAFELEF